MATANWPVCRSRFDCPGRSGCPHQHRDATAAGPFTAVDESCTIALSLGDLSLSSLFASRGCLLQWQNSQTQRPYNERSKEGEMTARQFRMRRLPQALVTTTTSDNAGSVAVL